MRTPEGQAGEPSAGSPPGTGSPAPADRASTARLVLLMVAALVTALLAPPVGALLGLLTLVLAVRARTLPTGTRVAAGVAGGLALALGVLVTALALLFRTEITDYSRCLQGANTRLAQQACQDELTASLEEALRSRFGLTP